MKNIFPEWNHKQKHLAGYFETWKYSEGDSFAGIPATEEQLNIAHNLAKISGLPLLRTKIIIAHNLAPFLDPTMHLCI